MININLFGGPSVGKSTAAAGLLHRMKCDGYNVEYIQEYPKELVFSNDTIRLSDQLHIIAEQNHKIHKLKRNVDFLIHDGPLLLSLIYGKHLGKAFSAFVVELFQSYENLNFLLERNDQIEFQKHGRYQNEEESKEIDESIKNLLDFNNIEYIMVKSGETITNDIMREGKKNGKI